MSLRQILFTSMTHDLGGHRPHASLRNPPFLTTVTVGPMGGLTPFEALQTATSVPAVAFGAGEDLGTIQPSTLADLVVVRGNPLENISDARRVEVVVKNGEVFTLEALLRGGRGLAAPVPEDFVIANLRIVSADWLRRPRVLPHGEPPMPRLP